MGAIGGETGVDAKLAHSKDYVVSRVDEVAVNDESVDHQLVLGIAVLMNDFHLFHYRRLSGLSRAWLEWSARCAPLPPEGI